MRCKGTDLQADTEEFWLFDNMVTKLDHSIMDKTELLQAISTALGKKTVKELALLHADSKLAVSDLLDLTFYRKPEVAFRAAWVLEFIVLTYPDSFKPLVTEFLDRYKEQNNPSCQRHFARIMMCLADPKYSKKLQLPSHYNLGPILEKTFEWLIEPKTPVAVKVHCMDVLFNFRNRLPWVAEELEFQIVYLLKTGSAALQSRGKAVLKKLRSRS
jgi:hypothetical protein